MQVVDRFGRFNRSLESDLKVMCVDCRQPWRNSGILSSGRISDCVCGMMQVRGEYFRVLNSCNV